MRLEFPWPPAALFPNARNSSHWSKAVKPARNARMLGWGLTAQAIGALLRQYEPPADGIEIRIVAIPPKRPGRPPDADGLLGACKAYLDGISSALGVDDKAFRFAPIEWLPKDGAGSIVISF